MDFICVKQCFYQDQIWDIGQKKEDDSDISKPSKKGGVSCWEKVSKKTEKAMSEETVDEEKKSVRDLYKMVTGELVLYVFKRFKGTKFDASMSKTAMIKEIAVLEKAKEREDRLGTV